MEKKLRLDKYLADMQVGTRSEVKQYIKKGRIKVNEQVEKAADRKISITEDIVTFDEHTVAYQSYEYYMFHKPAGCVSATEDKLHPTVLDYIDASRKDLFPVGRLDIDTEGLLLITNDGQLAHNLLAPKKHVNKTYYAKVSGSVTNEDIEKFQSGLDIGEKQLTRPATLEILTTGAVSEILVTLTEGKFHQVKRMFEAVDKEVIYLRRISMGALKLDEALQPGEYRSLTEIEIRTLSEKEQ